MPMAADCAINGVALTAFRTEVTFSETFKQVCECSSNSSGVCVCAL